MRTFFRITLLLGIIQLFTVRVIAQDLPHADSVGLSPEYYSPEIEIQLDSFRIDTVIFTKIENDDWGTYLLEELAICWQLKNPTAKGNMDLPPFPILSSGQFQNGFDNLNSHYQTDLFSKMSKIITGQYILKIGDEVVYLRIREWYFPEINQAEELIQLLAEVGPPPTVVACFESYEMLGRKILNIYSISEKDLSKVIIDILESLE